LPVYSQYQYNIFLINPAVAGSDGYTKINLTARQQWVGYSGAPRTFSFSVQKRMLMKDDAQRGAQLKKGSFRPGLDGKIGLGGFIYSDKNGLIQRTGFEYSYAYHMWLANSTQLSLGVAFTGYYYKINENKMEFENPDDPWMNNNLRKGMFVPDAAFGVYVLNPKYKLGLSADQLFRASARIAGSAFHDFRMDRHYYLFGSYNFLSRTDVVIQPSFLVVMSDQLKPEADFGSMVVYNEDFRVGLSYRTSGALIAKFGIRFQNAFIGYALDFTLHEIQKVTYGTHEITLAMRFGDSRRRYRWLERY
jgi:type IX secretion system PorP/SprF family membrane protein